MGGASIINTLASLIRNKIAALLLGPAGIGLIGLYVSLMSTAGTLVGLGFGLAGTRQIAAASARGDQAEIALARRALFWACLALAIIGGTIFFLLRSVLARSIFNDQAQASTVGWLALGVALSIAAGSQQALLKGLRHIGDLARIQIGAGILSTIAGTSFLLIWGSTGIIAFVLAGPFIALILGHWYVAKLEPITRTQAAFPDLANQWVVLLRLGILFAASGLVTTLGFLFVRVLIQRELGPEQLGQFQAAWTISMTYIGFTLSAMANDYYPRLTGVIDNPAEARLLVNAQTELALLLAGPVLIGTLALAPWLIHLLYTSDFLPAVEILRWQILGDILKVASWPLGFILLASSSGRTFLLTESIAIGAFVVLTAITLPLIGVKATGISFSIMYGLYLPMLFCLARRRIGLVWTKPVKRQFWLLCGIAVVVLVLAHWTNYAAMALGTLASAALGIQCLGRISTMGEWNGPLGKLAKFYRKLSWRKGAS